MSQGYQPRTYRANGASPDLKSWRVVLAETDLYIQAEVELRDLSRQSTREGRAQVEREIARCPEFLTSLQPLGAPEDAPPVVARMYAAAALARVGPMAAVAGAIAQYVGEQLEPRSPQVIVENGGDIYLQTQEEVRVGVFAGNSPLTYKVGLLLKPEQMPLGVCTSSGTVGHSLSFGKADAVCVLSKSSTLADAAATAIGNLVKAKEGIRTALEKGMTIEGVLGALIVMGEHFGVIGDIELI